LLRAGQAGGNGVKTFYFLTEFSKLGHHPTEHLPAQMHPGLDLAFAISLRWCVEAPLYFLEIGAHATNVTTWSWTPACCGSALQAGSAYGLPKASGALPHHYWLRSGESSGAVGFPTMIVPPAGNTTLVSRLGCRAGASHETNVHLSHVRPNIGSFHRNT
jgi:hypothetical protein